MRYFNLELTMALCITSISVFIILITLANLSCVSLINGFLFFFSPIYSFVEEQDTSMMRERD